LPPLRPKRPLGLMGVAAPGVRPHVSRVPTRAVARPECFSCTALKRDVRPVERLSCYDS
jgi:hypothetical protein